MATICTIDSRLLPLLAMSCPRSFRVTVFMAVNCSEFTAPNTASCTNMYPQRLRGRRQPETGGWSPPPAARVAHQHLAVAQKQVISVVVNRFIDMFATATGSIIMPPAAANSPVTCSSNGIRNSMHRAAQLGKQIASSPMRQVSTENSRGENMGQVAAPRAASRPPGRQPEDRRAPARCLPQPQAGQTIQRQRQRHHAKGEHQIARQVKTVPPSAQPPLACSAWWRHSPAAPPAR